ncbi:MAG: FAD-dependent oxidoreductase [Gemmatimonadota bacterium]|nr:FAD-dependent oxidoreductase [Gemmatimonadota bacterium]
MDRRSMLKTGTMGVLGLGLGGCATTGSSRESSLVLAPVRVSWDRIIRTTVGLRPHRPSGFVLRAERLDAKTVIHNYGHGGSGMSLSWGTGFMAAEIAEQQQERRAAVIGCGVVGLTTARQLQRRGFDVTIYAMAVPPDTTSNMSLAGFTPTSGLVETAQRTRAWDAQFRRAVEIAYKQLQLLVGPKYGITWMNGYSMRAAPPANASGRPTPPSAPSPPRRQSLLPQELRTGSVTLGPGEHPFPTPYVSYRPAIRIEPSIYLDALVEDVLLFGGDIVIRKFDTQRDLMSLEESVIVNCTGLGSSTLFNDRELTPLKGQLTVLVAQPEVDYNTFGGLRRIGGFGIHMQPRSDGIVLGGTSERGVWSLEPNEEARRQIVEGHIELFDAMRGLPPATRIASVGPPDHIPPVEAFFGLNS